MKIGFTFVLVALLPVMAQASGTVCSSEKLYYSSTRVDFGTRPPRGTVTGQTVIAYDGKILLNHTSIEGLTPHGSAPYTVILSGVAKPLATEGTKMAGARIYKHTARLVQLDPLHRTMPRDIAREEVVCRTTWALLP